MGGPGPPLWTQWIGLGSGLGGVTIPWGGAAGSSISDFSFCVTSRSKFSLLWNTKFGGSQMIFFTLWNVLKTMWYILMQFVASCWYHDSKYHDNLVSDCWRSGWTNRSTKRSKVEPLCGLTLHSVTLLHIPWIPLHHHFSFVFNPEAPTLLECWGESSDEQECKVMTARLSHRISVKNRREQTGGKCRSGRLCVSLLLQGEESEWHLGQPDCQNGL